MTHTTRSPWPVLVLVCSLCACSSEPQDAQSGPNLASADPTASGDAIDTSTPTTPTAGDPGTTPATTATDSTPPTDAAGAAGTSADEPAATDADQQTPASDDALATDHCQDRRVSYAAPCHDDPNPCGIDSGFAGDEYCLPPPPEGQGFQIHIGPDDYGDPAEIDKYVIQPGEEFNNSVLGHIPIDEAVWFDRITVQMRPGSHHWISRVVGGRLEERVYSDTSCGGAAQIGSIGGGQNLIYDNPPGGVPAPENEGLGRPLEGNSSLCMNLHAYNFTDEANLREMWINVYTVDESEVTQRAQSIGIVGGLALSVPPGASETLSYTETFSQPGRIIQLFGHRHAWTPRFAVWLNDELIYDSWDWQESIVFNYDSLTQNPPIDTEAQTDGAVSGVLEVAAGDELTFSCFIENESDVTLRFANELYTGEMCNLWGSAVGTGLNATRF